MNVEDLTIGEAKKLVQMFSCMGGQPKTRYKDQYCIIRCRDAGVWAGYVEERSGREVVLREGRRLWRWWSKFTLSELALHGPHPDHMDTNKYAEPMPEVELLDACETLPCSVEGGRKIREVPNYVN